MKYYKQCTLKKGNITQTAWIPEKYAVKEQVIKIRDENDVWVDGWVVMSDGETRKEESQLSDYRKMIRNHRKSTGDALPKVN